MSPELLDTLLGALRLALLFITGLLLPILLQVTLLFLAGWALNRLVAGVSRTVILLLGLIGTPVHEFSHALASTLTLCRVDAITPLVDESWSASVSVRRSNVVSNLVTPIAPLIGGTLVLWLTGNYVIPGFQISALTPPQLSLENVTSFGAALRESLAYLGKFLETMYRALPGLAWGEWRTYVGLYIALSVGIAISPSSDDLKIWAKSLPVAILLIIGLLIWFYALGDVEGQFLALQERLVPHLVRFSTAVTYAFVLSSAGVLILLPIGLWRRLRG